MGNHYINEVGTVIQLNTGIDLSLAESVSIYVKNPDCEYVVWPATVVSIWGSNSYVQYTIQAGDLPYPGTYTVQPYIVLPNWQGWGTAATFQVNCLYTQN